MEELTIWESIAQTIENSTVLSSIVTIIGIVIIIMLFTGFIYLIGRKKFKEKNIHYIDLFSIFIRWITKGKVDLFGGGTEVKDKKHEKEENEKVKTWAILEELLSTLNSERLSTDEKRTWETLNKNQKETIKRIKKVFICCAKEWNIIYNEMLAKKIIENYNINQLRKQFRDEGQRIITLLYEIDYLPKSLTERMADYHHNKLNKYIDFFLDKAVDDILYDDKIKKSIILNVWVYGLTLFIDDREILINEVIDGLWEEKMIIVNNLLESKNKT
jgi:hypothetical protein